MTDAERQLIKNFLLYGALVGGTAGGAAVGLHKLRSMSDAAKKRRTYDDDVLYVDVPMQETAKEATVRSLTLGTLGGMLTGAATFAVVRKAYEKMRRRELQQELDRAQRLYIERLNVSEEGEKAAATTEGRRMTAGDLFMAAPLLAPAATGVGAAALAYYLLNRYFPKKVKLRDAGTPASRVHIRALPADDAELPEKEAAAREFVLLHAAALTKQASNPGFTEDLLTAVAEGRLDEIRQAFREGGDDMVFAVTKGASSYADEGGDERWVTAAAMLAHDPELGPSAVTTAAAEVANLSPTFFKLAATFPASRALDDAPGLLACVRAGVVDDVEKSAAAPVALEDVEGLVRRNQGVPRLRKQLAASIDSPQLDRESSGANTSGDEVDAMLGSRLGGTIGKKKRGVA